MIVFNAGVPRSGTILVNAILRCLYEGAGLSANFANPVGRHVSFLVKTLIESGQDRRDNTLVHTHDWDCETARLVAGNASITGFLNRRDPRDVCVSLMVLHDWSFDAAVDMVLHYFAQFEETAAATSWPIIEYETLVSDKPATIRAIAHHLGFRPDAADLRRIDTATSVERHTAIMNKVRDYAAAKSRDLPDGAPTYYEDARTMINHRHIQSGKTGRWREELSAAQQAIATDVFAELIVE